MLIVLLVSLLLISFLVHINFILKYIIKRENVYYKGFIVTIFINFIIAGILIVIALSKPELIRDLDMTILVWVLSGVIMTMLLLMKISIFRNIYKRSKLPEHYHLNFFGKKVLHGTVVKPAEIVLFFGSIPFFLIAGAYFVARIINLIMYKHL